MPVSEVEAVDAVAMLPESSWIRTYVVHATRQTTAPLVYHIGVGIAVLGTTCPIPYGMHYAGALRANNFVLCVGRSGEDHRERHVDGLHLDQCPQQQQEQTQEGKGRHDRK